MCKLSISLLVFSLVGYAHMFHTQNDPANIARVCTRYMQRVCSYHSPPLICRGHQYEDASPVTAMCDYPGQRTCGIPPFAVSLGNRLRDPYYCFRRG